MPLSMTCDVVNFGWKVHDKRFFKNIVLMYNSLFKYIVIHSYSYKITVLELEIEKVTKARNFHFSWIFSLFLKIFHLFAWKSSGKLMIQEIWGSTCEHLMKCIPIFYQHFSLKKWKKTKNQCFPGDEPYTTQL